MPSPDPPADQTPWLSPVSAAAYLGVALGTLRNWTAQRVVPFVKLGKLVRYHRAALDRWLEAGASPGQTQPTHRLKQGQLGDGDQPTRPT